MRQAKIFCNGTWVDIPFTDLKRDDVFRLYEEDGSIVADDDGNDTWIAVDDVILIDDEHGIYCKAYQIV